MTSITRKLTRYTCTVLFLLLLSLVLIRCTANAPPGGGSSGNDNSGGPSPGNDPPVADAGEDQVVTAGATVTLDGSGSRDPDGDPLTFSWEQTLGTPVSLSGTSDPVVTCTAPANGTTLVFALTVSDGQNESVGEVSVSVHPADESAQVIEVRQRPITDDPAVNGDLEARWTVATVPEAPPPLDDDEFEPDDRGGPAALRDIVFAPVVEEDLSPGESREVELRVAGPSMLMGSVRWSGSAALLDVALSLDGSILATGSPYTFAGHRGGSAVATRSTTGGRVTLSVTNPSDATVTVRIELGAIGV